MATRDVSRSDRPSSRRVEIALDGRSLPSEPAPPLQRLAFCITQCRPQQNDFQNNDDNQDPGLTDRVTILVAIPTLTLDLDESP